MIFGIGTDIVAFERIESLHLRYGERFARRILSGNEMAEYMSHAQPARLLMKRFAAKEALSKAAGSGLRHPLGMTQITVAHDMMGKPVFRFGTELEEHFSKLGILHHHLSISDEQDRAIAFVILEGVH